MRKCILLSISLVTILHPSITKSETFTETLQKYCVPKSEDGCLNKATYVSTLSDNQCQCGSCNMYYDKESRSCKECPAGTYVDNKNSTKCITPTCGVGSYKVLEVGKDTCGIGYYKIRLSGCN